jgi:hypothetical protein
MAGALRIEFQAGSSLAFCINFQKRSMSSSNLKQAYTCKLKEAQEMLKQGAPLSVIARTLQIKIIDIMHLDNSKALGK